MKCELRITDDGLREGNHGPHVTWARRVGCLLVAAMCVAVWVASPARADIFTPVASYEPAETDLAVTSGDAGLSVAIVQGGVGGVPAATDGANVLQITIANESDRKVELRHNWSASTYDLAGADELLADVYIASSGALPGLMGIWSSNWSPPDEWQQATGIPTTVGSWYTVSFNVATREQVGLDFVWAFILENMAGASGTAYVDNLRLRGSGAVPDIRGFAANAYADRIALVWSTPSTPGLEGFNVYRADAPGGPFVKLNVAPVGTTAYDDMVGENAPEHFYYVAVQVGGADVAQSGVVSAQYNGLTDDELLDIVQRETLRYFWEYGHPASRMAREGYNFGHPTDTVTTGGTGMGLMSIVVGAERGFVARADAASRVLVILNFLENGVTRYHGAWAHHYNGATGATIAFAGPQDNGGDLVETAFLVQGILTCRQYFDDPVDAFEAEIRTRATRLWEEVEWDWYRQFPGGDVLYWHWSSDFGWVMNLPIRGYNEAMIVYLLAVASPTHPMPPSSFHNGWAGLSSYTNPGTFYGFRQWVGPNYGGPLFFTHYSNLGFDPRYKRDVYANYFENARNTSLIHQAYCISNPGGYADYSPFVWGLTSSAGPSGYREHFPFYDDGTITPTAALSAMPYTPEASLAAMRHLYDNYPNLWGPYGFYDAFNPDQSWVGTGNLAIDQGTIMPMIENYRTGLCWRLFMSNPEIRGAMTAIGMFFEVDFDQDGDIDAADYAVIADCVGGPGAAAAPGGCSASEFAGADLDNDGDVDLHDAAIFQALFDVP